MALLVTIGSFLFMPSFGSHLGYFCPQAVDASGKSKESGKCLCNVSCLSQRPGEQAVATLSWHSKFNTFKHVWVASKVCMVYVALSLALFRLGVLWTANSRLTCCLDIVDDGRNPRHQVSSSHNSYATHLSRWPPSRSTSPSSRSLS
jgi:hypothetical protein